MYSIFYDVEQTNMQAGELGLEIYALSLSSKSRVLLRYIFLPSLKSDAYRLDDTRLARLVSLLPTRGILVLEDIDCAFPSRADGDEDDYDAKPWIPRKSQVTMSGLLNILDGIGSGTLPSRVFGWRQG